TCALPISAVLEELAEGVGGAVRIAHQEAPGAAELGVHVAVRRHLVVDERFHERVDAVAGSFALVRPLRLAGHEARVIDDEIDVRVALRHDADVVALAVLVGSRPERQALVDADDAHAERARLLDERVPGVLVGQAEALAVRTTLLVRLSVEDYSPVL